MRVAAHAEGSKEVLFACSIGEDFGSPIPKDRT
jgi:hypothetical protein